MIMLIFIKQHLSNIWSSTHEKLSSTEAKFKKSVAYWKKRITQNDIKRNYIRKCIFRHGKYVCINIQRERETEREREKESMIFIVFLMLKTHQLTILGVIQFSERVFCLSLCTSTPTKGKSLFSIILTFLTIVWLLLHCLHPGILL